MLEKETRRTLAPGMPFTEEALTAPRARPAMIAHNVRDLVMDGFRTDTVAGSGPVLLFESVAGALIQGCRTARGAGRFLRVGGAGSEGIHLLANDLSRAGAAVEFADGAPSSAVRLTGNLVRKKRGKE